MDHVRLPSGRDVMIRPICSGDEDALRAAYSRLSPTSQYRRFLAPKPYLTQTETRYLVQIDGRDHHALVATPDRPDVILGVARFVRFPEDPHAAEIAVVVGDPFQREGLASELLERLADAARDRGIDRFRATMLVDNHPAHQMMRRLARGPSRERRVGHTVEIELQLAPREAMIVSCHGS